MHLEEDTELQYLRVAPTLKDYPQKAIREGAEGTSYVRLTVDPPGQLVDCAIYRSSGWQLLDDGSCTLYRKHGQFKLRSTKPVSVVAPVAWKLMD
jgi:protein TonB